MNESGSTGGRPAEKVRYGALLVVIGWVCALLSLLRVPFIFGVVGVIMGILAAKGGSRAGLSVIVANIIFMAVGLVFSDVIWNYFSRFLGI